MELIGFEKRELEILESILQISTNVSNELERLCTLEIGGLKDSPVYRQALYELIRTINIENEKLKSTELSYSTCDKFIKFLSNQTKLPIFDVKPTTSITNAKHKNIKRVINILTSLMINKTDFHNNILNENLTKQILNLRFSKNKETLMQSLMHSVKIQTAIDTDINSMFLSILEDEINKQLNPKYRLELIKAKYCIATTNKELETFLIETKFNIPNTIYINSKITTQLLQEGEKSYNFIRFAQLKSKAKIEISKLLNIKDSEYNNQNRYINSIITSCYIRALLSLMTNEEIHDFNQEFHNHIESPDYLKEHLTDRISENIIINCFKCFKYDKSKTRILSAK